MSDLRTLEIAYHRASVDAADARKVSNASLRQRDELYTKIVASKRTLDGLLYEFGSYVMKTPLPVEEGRDLQDFVFFSRLGEQYRDAKMEHHRLQSEASQLEAIYRESWQKADQARLAQDKAAEALLKHLEQCRLEDLDPTLFSPAASPETEADPEAHPS